MLVAEPGRRAGELAVLHSPAQSLRYPQMVCRIATISDACPGSARLDAGIRGTVKIRWATMRSAGERSRSTVVSEGGISTLNTLNCRSGSQHSNVHP